MSAVIMDGKALASKIKSEVRSQVDAMSVKPGLAVILAGDNPASRVYVRGKAADCAECGIYSEVYTLPEETEQNMLLDLIGELNTRSDIDGILVQLPLPAQLDSQAALLAIRTDKDVDCFHPYNAGRLMTGDPFFLPCTPAGIMRMLSEYSIDPAGQNCVIVGRSNIVGKPLAMLMLQKHATVTVCHTRTRDLKAACLQADILVSAAGRRNLITADMIKEGAAVIDVSMNRNEQGKLCGDVDFAPAAEKAAFITPVPGGVGPMTRAMLMENTLTAARGHGKA